MDSFFTLSKLFWFVAAPSNALVLCVVLAALLLVAGWRRSGRALMVLGIAGLLVFGFSPVSNYILSPLEERFPPFQDDGRPITGIIVLGGPELPEIAMARGQPSYAEGGERFLMFVALARRYPQARLAFVSGSGALMPSGEGVEAKMTRQALRLVGIDPARVEMEEHSRNTAENALFAKQVLKPQPGENWILVTSAFHMPRAVGCFRAVDFPVLAFPVDYRTVSAEQLNAPFSRAATGLNFTDFSVKEWVGLVVYYLTGKTESLFPAP
ncbi:YdcF family protein [Xanthobacter sp. TB0139]|uniref:YdcF family protein n=1 Tax=Xanthobacter sp. TB0139 TaxID=3459178 RepID=UPI0040394446